MDDSKKQSAGNQVPPDEPVEGRLYDSRNPKFKNMDTRDDISHMDEQEGEMKHGTTGDDKVQKIDVEKSANE